MQHDDDLSRFAAEGASLPEGGKVGTLERAGARIWFASFGSGPAVLLLHGGLGHSGNWGRQIPALRDAGYRVVTIDSRGHGRSTRDAEPYHYRTMAEDALGVMDQLGLAEAAVVGWSDGACTGMLMAEIAPERVRGLFFFACNTDPSGTKPVDFSAPALGHCFGRHVKDYAALSATPDDFEAFSGAVEVMMKTEPNYSAEDLGRIRVPVALVLGESDEFIRPEHMDALAAAIPGGERVVLPGVSHFAPLQRPEVFNGAVLGFLRRL